MLFHVISCKFHLFYQGTKREVFQAEEQGMHLLGLYKKNQFFFRRSFENRWRSMICFFPLRLSRIGLSSALALPGITGGWGGGKNHWKLPFPSPLSSLLRHLHDAAHGAHPLVTASGRYRGESPESWANFWGTVWGSVHHGNTSSLHKKPKGKGAPEFEKVSHGWPHHLAKTQVPSPPWKVSKVATIPSFFLNKFLLHFQWQKPRYVSTNIQVDTFQKVCLFLLFHLSSIFPCILSRFSFLKGTWHRQTQHLNRPARLWFQVDGWNSWNDLRLLCDQNPRLQVGPNGGAEPVVPCWGISSEPTMDFSGVWTVSFRGRWTGDSTVDGSEIQHCT